jgi:hypothetical protein
VTAQEAAEVFALMVEISEQHPEMELRQRNGAIYLMPPGAKLPARLHLDLIRLATPAAKMLRTVSREWIIA